MLTKQLSSRCRIEWTAHNTYAWGFGPGQWFITVSPDRGRKRWKCTVVVQSGMEINYTLPTARTLQAAMAEAESRWPVVRGVIAAGIQEGAE